MTPTSDLSRWGDAVATADVFAFEDAVRPYLATMGRLAARLAPRDQPEDVVQDALLRAWRFRSTFDSHRGTLAGWLFAITANEALRTRRRWRHGVQRPRALPEPTIEDRLDVEAALELLSMRQRLAVNCHYYAGLSVVETAAVMGCSEGTVKSTLADARDRLRRELQAGER